MITLIVVILMFFFIPGSISPLLLSDDVQDVVMLEQP